jgi:nicotinic acetylcholine receptor
MPKSNSIPLLGYYILSVIILCAVSVAFSLLFLTLSRRLVEKGRIPSSFTYKLVFLDAKKFVGATKSRTPRRSTIFRPSLTKTLLNGINKQAAAPPQIDPDETK